MTTETEMKWMLDACADVVPPITVATAAAAATTARMVFMSSIPPFSINFLHLKH
ncbi:hypothetical protein [Streptomyces lydicus]|uniref:hypothetical protein n=1 Tax=Streptomyces lydicus TaxID=47763 RepID=UPI0037A6CF00